MGNLKVAMAIKLACKPDILAVEGFQWHFWKKLGNMAVTIPAGYFAIIRYIFTPEYGESRGTYHLSMADSPDLKGLGGFLVVLQDLSPMRSVPCYKPHRGFRKEYQRKPYQKLWDRLRKKEPCLLYIVDDVTSDIPVEDFGGRDIAFLYCISRYEVKMQKTISINDFKEHDDYDIFLEHVKGLVDNFSCTTAWWITNYAEDARKHLPRSERWPLPKWERIDTG